MGALRLLFLALFRFPLLGEVPAFDNIFYAGAHFFHKLNGFLNRIRIGDAGFLPGAILHDQRQFYNHAFHTFL